MTLLINENPKAYDIGQFHSHISTSQGLTDSTLNHYQNIFLSIYPVLSFLYSERQTLWFSVWFIHFSIR